MGQPLTPFGHTGERAGDTDARLEQQIVESYLARIEQTLEARVDQLVDERVQGMPPAPRRALPNFTGRIAASLGVGIPLTAVAGGIAGGHAGGVGAVIAVVASLAVVLGLNVYYTEAEKQLVLAEHEVEKERLRRRP
ncbi:MAG TPA: hypothetical protein VFA70_03100 [Dehalococcoidia bacterium]|jgi:ribulose kinase|nr:hypothetical protein [Dehalococcoidia bacterium]